MLYRRILHLITALMLGGRGRECKAAPHGMIYDVFGSANKMSCARSRPSCLYLMFNREQLDGFAPLISGSYEQTIFHSIFQDYRARIQHT